MDVLVGVGFLFGEDLLGGPSRGTDEEHPVEPTFVGRVAGGQARGGARVVRALVPLSEMFGYTTDLRSSTQGRATSTMHFERYEQAPKNVAEAIINKYTGKDSDKK